MKPFLSRINTALKVAFLATLTLFFVACGASKTPAQQANETAKQQPCFSCEDPRAFEAKIRGLLYISDVGLRCCADKRTIDKSVALKKVYIHRVTDLDEEKKRLQTTDKTLFINERFDVAYIDFLKQELNARGIVVVEGINKSPYVTRVELDFIDLSASVDETGLHSTLNAQLKLKDINTDQNLVLRTKQDVMGFSKLEDISFYSFLLIKQLANKTASIISAL